MREEIPYLSEEELEQLILQVEQSELVAAPPSLYENCIQGEKISVQETLEDKREKAIEFRRYCFQVITSVAAAIAIVFGLPHMEVKPKTEVLSRQEVQKRSFTREEVLHDVKMFNGIFQGENEFDETNGNEQTTK